MKLFDMRGADAMDVLVDLCDPLSHLISNKETGEVILKASKLCSTGLPAVLLCPLLVVTLKPLMQGNKEDLLRVAAALTGKGYADVCDQPIHVTARDIIAVWDDDMRDFFTSSADTEAAE